MFARGTPTIFYCIICSVKKHGKLLKNMINLMVNQKLLYNYCIIIIESIKYLVILNK